MRIIPSFKSFISSTSVRRIGFGISSLGLNRRQLLKVAKLGPKAYEQCAGFMRIQGGDNPLDGTSVHPESYAAAENIMLILPYADGFRLNLHKLCQRILKPPGNGGRAPLPHTVLGWDPAFRTGCKLAVVDPTGKVIGTTVIYPTAPTTPQKIQASKDLLKKIIKKYDITLISVGNGTASRESEKFIVELLVYGLSPWIIFFLR